MTYYSNPKKYWEERLESNFTLAGVGHHGFNKRYNRWLYRRKVSCLQGALGGLPMRGKRVLDVGCGTGFFVRWYLAKGCEVMGIDITDTSVNQLQAALPGRFYTRDITAVNYPRSRGDFDLVNVWDVIYHIVDDDAYGRALRNISNEVRIGGLLLLTDFFGGASDNWIAPHVRGRCLKTHERILLDKGFELVEIRPLFRFLGKAHFGRLDNYLGGAYCFLDYLCERGSFFARSIAPDSVSLSVWRRCTR